MRGQRRGGRTDIHGLPQGPLAGTGLDQLPGAIEQGNQAAQQRVGIFTNDAAITRLIGAILLEQNDAWQVSRRYLSLESLSPVLMTSQRDAEQLPNEEVA